MSDTDWISITEAAERLTTRGDRIERSTLSRYLKQHAEALPLKRQGKSNLVNFPALVAHRQENIRIEPAGAGPGPVSETGAAQTKPEFKHTQANGAARKALADAELREMDLATRRKELAPVDEVDTGGRNAIALMQSSFDRAVETEAAELSVRYGWDERQVRLALKTFARKGTDVFHREMLKMLDGFRRAEQGAPVADAPQSQNTDFTLQ